MRAMVQQRPPEGRWAPRAQLGLRVACSLSLR